MPAQWYVARVKPRKERAVRIWLERTGVEAYSPEIVVVQRGRKRLESLFPSYLFVHTDTSSERWPMVRWARGLSYFLGEVGRPSPVDEQIVPEIQARVMRWNAGGWAEALREGQRVVITVGALRGLEAIFQRYVPAKERCLVLVSLVGRPFAVSVGITDIESVSLRPRLAFVG